MTKSLRPGIYQHYKGLYYQVLGLSRHSETLEPLVVYQTLYGEFGLWVRPLEMFLEQVGDVSRFRFVSEGIHGIP